MYAYVHYYFDVKYLLKVFINFFLLFVFTQIFESPEFEKFLARREIKMQKTTEGLGIMIIEGSHKAFGKGIFVSDIQQNSLAFKVCSTSISFG